MKKNSHINSITDDTRVILHELSVRKDGEEYIVGRKDTGDFVALPPEGEQLIRLMQKGQTIEEIKKNFGKPLDINDFIQTLLELKFIRSINEHTYESASSKGMLLQVYDVLHLGWLFTLPSKIIVTLIIVSATVRIMLTSSFPHYSDFFWTKSPTILIIGNTLFSVIILFLHELSHLYSAYSKGVEGKMSFGTRLHTLVVQTDVSGLWALEEKERYPVYLAGIVCNLFLISVSILISAYVPLPSLIIALLKSIILINMVMIINEFFVFMRTDIYFVMLNLLHCYNLYNDALAYFRYLGSKIWHTFRKSVGAMHDPLKDVPKSEQKKIKIYMLFMVIGSVLSLLFFVLYSVPIALRLYARAYGSIVLGLTHHLLPPFVDGTVTLAIEGFFLLLFLKTFLKKLRSVNKIF